MSVSQVACSVPVRPEQHITLVTDFPTRCPPPAADVGARFDSSSIASADNGGAVVSDRQLDRVAVFSRQGELLLTVPTTSLGKPISVETTADGDVVFSRDRRSVCVYSSSGQPRRTLKDGLSRPCGVCCGGPDRQLYVLDYASRTVSRYASDYSRSGVIRLQYDRASVWDRLAVSSTGNLYVCSYTDNCVYEFTACGQRLAAAGRWGSGGAGDLYWPRGMCIDTHDNVIVADTHNDRLQLLSASGDWTVLTPDVALAAPTDVAVGQDGTLLVLEKAGVVKVFDYLPY